MIDAKVKAHINSLDIKSVVNSTVESKVSDNDGNELGMKNNSMLNFSGDETIKVELDPISQTLKIMMREKPDDFAAKIQPFLDAIYESMNQMHQAAMVGKK
ncbi:hypothetical protein KAU11_11750 [Candidatus Babeliales bacterium]|nr:hypothetical protein [Candidatus Babeliales bacterium]